MDWDPAGDMSCDDPGVAAVAPELALGRLGVGFGLVYPVGAVVWKGGSGDERCPKSLLPSALFSLMLFSLALLLFLTVW